MILLRQKMYARRLGPSNGVWTNLGVLENSVKRDAQPARFIKLRKARALGEEYYRAAGRDIYSGSPHERVRIPKKRT